MAARRPRASTGDITRSVMRPRLTLFTRYTTFPSRRIRRRARESSATPLVARKPVDEAFTAPVGERRKQELVLKMIAAPRTRLLWRVAFALSLATLGLLAVACLDETSYPSVAADAGVDHAAPPGPVDAEVGRPDGAADADRGCIDDFDAAPVTCS